MANNQYNNKVELSDGTTLIDLSNDTAVASDVAQGKYFHLATGERVVGTASGGTPSLQTKSVTPTESAQIITADDGYDGLSSVDIEAISNTYVGTGIARRSFEGITFNDQLLQVASGYYQSNLTKRIDKLVVSGSITPVEKVQSITLTIPCANLSYFIMAPSDGTLRKPGYKALNVIFADNYNKRVMYITTNNGGTDNMGYSGSFSDTANNKVTITVYPTTSKITLSSTAITGRTFGYFMGIKYNWFAFGVS